MLRVKRVHNIRPDLKLMHEKTKRQKLEASMQREWVSREKRESIAKAPCDDG
jgi:hypothetical protein